MKTIWRAGASVTCLIAFAAIMQCGGSGHIAPLTISPGALPNGTAGTPYSEQVQVSGGVASYTWAIAGTLPHGLRFIPGPGNAATISGTPDTPIQADPFTVRVSDSASQSDTQPYTVSILALPDTLTLTPASLNFNGQLDGTASGTQIATLSNTGSAAVAINGVASTGNNSADFTQTNTCTSSLAAGANCVISVTFTPAQAGPRVASITINDDTTGSPHQLGLNGTGLTSGANATLSASSLAFSGQAVGTTSPAEVITLSNYGTASLGIANVAATGDFSETNSCGPTLPSAASCPIRVSFTPSTLGSLTGTLSVTDNLTGSPQTVSLNGTGVTIHGTLTGGCFGTLQSNPAQCGTLQDLTSCPPGVAALKPAYLFQSCATTQSPLQDGARQCSGKSIRPHDTNVGYCLVNP